LIDAN
jgi:serine/threonine protein kinase